MLYIERKRETNYLLTANTEGTKITKNRTKLKQKYEKTSTQKKEK